jgi:hypothetical protein
MQKEQMKRRSLASLAALAPMFSNCGCPQPVPVAWDGTLAPGVSIVTGPDGGRFARFEGTDSGQLALDEPLPFFQSVDSKTCARLCTKPNFMSGCWIVDAGQIQCGGGCPGGRAPPGLAGLSILDSTAGSWLARMAQLESAAVDAFVHLSRELDALHFSEFSGASIRAAEEEMRHAQLVSKLALRRGYLPHAPHIYGSPLRDLETVAIDNAREGCGRELFGAFTNVHQAENAKDPDIAQAMRSIAKEELSHAEFSFSLAQAFMPQLSKSQRRRVREAQEIALLNLGAEAVSESMRDTLGLMNENQSSALARRLIDECRI